MNDKRRKEIRNIIKQLKLIIDNPINQTDLFDVSLEMSDIYNEEYEAVENKPENMKFGDDYIKGVERYASLMDCDARISNAATTSEDKLEAELYSIISDLEEVIKK